jgi:ribosomal protein S7
MVGMRSDRARARARDLLATAYPVPRDVESERLHELAIEFVEEAKRLEAENKGHAIEAEEMISAALDAVARDYFSRTVGRAMSRRKR